MENLPFHDGNIFNLIEDRHYEVRRDVDHTFQMHSSLIRRLSQEAELEGHQSCVNSVAWNSKGSLLISGSDDTRLNIWSYSSKKLLYSIDTGHSANIFCTKFVPETSDELVVSGAGDAEVRLFNLSRLSGGTSDDNAIAPLALYQCHTTRVKKLAVESGNPNVVWSASEDGTLRQHDFREGTSCPPAGSSHQECRNILLDLRGGAKRSLVDPPKQVLALKSCDISSSRPHLLLVGGSDAFARLYDRRMLPPPTSCRKRMSPPPCINYFCPMHLSERGRPSVHLTHVTFSPDGEEVLLSYSGEHVYLMNVNHAGGSSMQYSSRDASKLMCFTPILNGAELHPSNCDLEDNSSWKGHYSPRFEKKCRKLVQFAEKCLEEGTNYVYGIEACNEVIDGHAQEIAPSLRHDCLCTRAALLLKRQWKNDVHMAVRDCFNAWKLYSSSFRALSHMSEALSQLGKHKEALDCAIAAQTAAPSNSGVAEWVENMKKNVAAAEAEKYKANDGPSKMEPRAGRVLSLSDILYRSEANSDASQDGPRFEREDSDSDEELELDSETSVSGDEGGDESNNLHGSLNLRIHRRGNGLCESPSSSAHSDNILYQDCFSLRCQGAVVGHGYNSVVNPPIIEVSIQFLKRAGQKYDYTYMPESPNTRVPFFPPRKSLFHVLPEAVIDMKQRYVGHCNTGTDIKQASFLGQRGEFVASGSDDGRWYIWEKKTGRLVNILHGDEAVVNCVQCHPYDSVVATSGIDNTIKIWTPSASVPSVVAGGAARHETANVLDIMENNHRRLSRSHEATLPFELLERFRMHEFAEGTFHPFECAQS